MNYVTGKREEEEAEEAEGKEVNLVPARGRNFTRRTSAQPEDARNLTAPLLSCTQLAADRIQFSLVWRQI